MKNHSLNHENVTINALFNKFFFYLKENKKILFSMIFFIFIIFSCSFYWIKKSNYVFLYKNLSSKNNIQVVIQKLISLKIPYKYSDESNSLLIPEDKVEFFYSHLNELKLDDQTLSGFELLDQEKFGITSFHEQINYQRALEGELSRTIEKINFVKSARVHIVFAKNTSFFNEDTHSSVSVFLKVNENIKINKNLYNSIIFLLSTSIPDLKKKDITIINQYGEIFTGDKDIFSHSLNCQNLDDITFIEEKYQEKIKNILIPIFGSKNISIQVSVEIDDSIEDLERQVYNIESIPEENFFDIKKKNENIIEKNTNYNIQIQDTKENVIYTNSACCQTYDFLKKKVLFYDIKNQKNNKNTNDQNNFYYLNKKNYGNNFFKYLSNKILYKKNNIRKIKRFSISVLINYKKNSKGEYIPLNCHEIFKIRKLVETTVGFSKNRGDSINIINYKFFESESPLIPVIPIKKNEYFDKTLILIPWFLVFFFLVLFLMSFFSFRKLTKRIQSNNFGIMNNIKKYFKNSNNDIKDNINNNTKK